MSRFRLEVVKSWRTQIGRHFVSVVTTFVSLDPVSSLFCQRKLRYTNSIPPWIPRVNPVGLGRTQSGPRAVAAYFEKADAILASPVLIRGYNSVSKQSGAHLQRVVCEQPIGFPRQLRVKYFEFVSRKFPLPSRFIPFVFEGV